MNSLTPSDFDFTFLEEGFNARDIVEQNINELSMSVSTLRRFIIVCRFPLSAFLVEVLVSRYVIPLVDYNVLPSG